MITVYKVITNCCTAGHICYYVFKASSKSGYGFKEFVLGLINKKIKKDGHSSPHNL